MSASPAGGPPGQGPNGSAKQQQAPPRRLARPKPTNPLVQRKPKKKPTTTTTNSKPAPKHVAPTPGATGHMGSAALAARPGRPMMPHVKARLAAKGPLTLEDRPYGDSSPSLFTEPPKQGNYTDFKVYTTKKALMEGLRLHVARLSSHKSVDIRDKTQFTPPLYLLRRDIKAPLPESKEDVEMKEGEEEVKPEVKDEEAQREAEKAAARAEIAPSQGGTKPRKQQPTKKTQQVFLKDQTAEQKYKQQLKYEEALPWHLEDDEHKQVWMGTYEEMSSNTWAQFRLEERNGEPVAIMTPLEKWYKFTPKSRVDAEVMRQHEEQQMAKVKKEESEEPDFMKAFERAIKKEEDDREDTMAARGRLFIAKGKSDEIGTKNEEELDFEEDWADDEAPPEIEGEEEEVKDIESRIKKDQLKSNVFGMVGTGEYENEDERERREAEYRKKVGKKTAKALVKREHNAIYESDNENEYEEKSDSTDTEEEILREKEKKEAEAKAAATAATAGKTGSGPPSRNNTPSHRPSKHPEPLSKTSAAGVKRSGSPNLSEASGNESAANRKKLKKSKLSKLVAASQPPSRPRSPANGGGGPGASRPGIAARASFAGSGSDTDTASVNRLRLKASGVRSPSPPNGTPGASRIGSRATSPDATAGAPAAAPPIQKFRSVPSNEKLRELIPPQGLPLSSLSKYFEISNEERKTLINRFKEVSVYNKETKSLMPLPAKPT